MKIHLITLLLTFAIGSCSYSKSENDYAYLYKDLPFDMPVLSPPNFANNKVYLSDFGGVGDGCKLNTDAFAEAIDDLSKKGGGKLVVGAGVWLTGPICFKSNINLHLEDRAIILFSPDKDLYPIIETSFEGLDTRRCQSPISGKDLENIAITGSGVIDGNGQFWRPLKKQKVSESQWRKATSVGGVFKRDDYWMPSAAYLHGDTISNMNVPKNFTSDEEWQSIRDFLRPVMISFQNCKNVFLQGVIFQNSPAWNIHPLMCENVILDNVQVRNPSYAQNGDGLDLESCLNTIVVNCSFDVGDDGICIKSGKDEDGRKRARACENVIVDNCTVFKGHGGFVVGSEMSGGVKNVSVSNCQFLGTDVGLRFKSRRGRGGVVENIYISNISMFNIATEPLLFNLYYGGKSAIETLEDGDEITQKEVFPQVDETTPTFRNIYISNIVCQKARRAMYFFGLPEHHIDNINISNVSIHSKLGAEINESSNIKLHNVSIYPEEAPALKLRNVNGVDVQDFNTNNKHEVIFDISGKRTANIKLNLEHAEDKLLFGDDMNKGEISITKL